MAKKNQGGQEPNPVKTRKDEVVISSLDPRDLFNKFLTRNLCRTWKEDFIDEETNEVVTIDRSEIILSKGTCLSSENLAKVNFHIQCGDITKPVEVSNQSRQAEEAVPYRHPHTCKVGINGQTMKFLLVARGVQQALDIVRDWCELKYSGQFAVTEVRQYDSAVILVDRLRSYAIDEAQLRYEQGEIPFEEFMDQDVKDSEYGKDGDGGGQVKFYKIRAAILKDGERDSENNLFVVLATDADRAILTINAYLQQKQIERNMRMTQQGRMDEVEHRKVTATIEECKIESMSRLIPDAFCRAYYEEETNDARP